MMSSYDLLEYHGDSPLLLIGHEEITHALLQYNNCEFGLSDRSYRNNSILFDPTSDDDVKWLLRQGECRLALLSFHQYEYTRRVINFQKAVASGHRITSRLKQFPPEDSRVSSIEHLLQAQFCYAAFSGDCDEMQSLLPYCRAHNCECVHYAAAGGHVEIIRRLLQEGYPVDSTNSHGQSPLHIAALFGWNEVAVELIKRGADIDKPIIEEYTHCPPLDGVVYGLPEHLDTVLAIIDQGYSFSSDEVNAFLLICVRHRSTLMLDVIEQKCHDEDSYHRNAVHVATFKRFLFKMIRTGDSKDSEEMVFGSALHQATLRGHVSTVRLLLENNCSTHSVDSLGRSALHVAAEGGHSDCVEALIEHHCPVNSIDLYGCTPLHDAAAEGRTEVAILLIKGSSDKDPNACGFGTPLHQAAISGHLKTVKALLDEGCSVLAAVNDNGQTALHFASQKGHVGIIRVLLRYNCPIDIRDKCGCTALHDAAACDQTEAVVELIKNGAEKDVVAGKYGTPLHQAAIKEHLKTLKALLDEGCSVLAVNDNGQTALHCVAQKGHVGIIRVLLNQNCPIDKRDKSGRTALHDAAACNQTEAVVELIKNGAEKDVVAVGYGTPLHLAADEGYIKTVQALLFTW